MKFCPVNTGLHCKDHLKSHFFGRIFISVFFVEIFNFIGYANITTCDIPLHNDLKVKLFNISEEVY